MAQGWKRALCWVCVWDTGSPGAIESCGPGTVLLSAPAALLYLQPELRLEFTLSANPASPRN